MEWTIYLGIGLILIGAGSALCVLVVAMAIDLFF